MDYQRTTEKYRRRETQARMRFFIRAGVFILAFCGGWLLGVAQSPSPISDHDYTILADDNARLTQELASTQAELSRTQQERREAQLLAGTAGAGNGDGGGGSNSAGNSDDEAAKARQLLASQIAKGIPPTQISQSLHALTPPNKCREIAQRDVEVITPYFSGGESNRNFLSDTLVLFIEGEAEAPALGQTWYDATKPVMVRASYLGGEQMAEGVLPLTMHLTTSDWLIRVGLAEAELNGYVRVRLSKCVFG